MISETAGRVLGFGREHSLFDADNIIVGLSGGSDSVCLLSVLRELADNDPSFPKLHAFHLEHGIRGGEALRDLEFSRGLCGELGIPFTSGSCDIPSEAKRLGRSLEETGRIVRYAKMRELGESLTGSYLIAVAHHKGDVAETFLMNLFRGSGTDGLVSPAVRNGDIIRPLLFLGKKEILAYLDQRGTGYVEDSTNTENDCTRNIWRNEIIPQISRVSVKSPEDAVWDTYGLLRSDLECLDDMAEQAYAGMRTYAGTVPVIPVRSFRGLHRAVALRVIRKLWKETCGDLTDFERVHTEAVYEAVTKGVTTSLDLPFSHRGRIVSEVLLFEEQAAGDLTDEQLLRWRGFIASPAPFETEIPLSRGTDMTVPGTDIRIHTDIVENNSVLSYNNYSWFYPVRDPGEVLTVRNGVRGLHFRRAGSSTGKDLGDVFSDLKLPAKTRDGIIAFVSGEDVLFVPGLGHSAGFTGGKSHEAYGREEHGDVLCLLAVGITREGMEDERQ